MNQIKYIFYQNNFNSLPGIPISYWANQKVINFFENYPSLEKLAIPKCGLKTGITEKYVKNWHEVNLTEISFHSSNRDEAILSKCKWFPVVNGGNFRKWYGNFNDVVWWYEDGRDIRNLRSIN